MLLPLFFAGLKFCANSRNSHLLHLIWGSIYAICGVVQFVAGIYFMLELPIFQLGSNIWTGSWVNANFRAEPEEPEPRFHFFLFQNCFSGLVIILIGCAGTATSLKAQGFLLLSLLVAIINLVNLVILEVGEWRKFLTPEDRHFIKDQAMDDLMYSAYLCTTISTVIAMITSFLASQHALFFHKVLSRQKETGATMGLRIGSSLPTGNIVHHHYFDRDNDQLEDDDDDSLMPKVCHFPSFSILYLLQTCTGIQNIKKCS